MEDPVFKQKYQKYKLRVKLWEKDFRKKYDRIPSKYDIREASQEIRDSYKMYYKLKTSFLEDTLNDVLSDDGFDVFEISQKETDEQGRSSETIQGVPHLPLDITNLVQQHSDESHYRVEYSNEEDIPGNHSLTKSAKRKETYSLKVFEPVVELTLNNNAWGTSLSMKSAKMEKKDIATKGVEKNFKEKLFQNSSFSKRNPRKSFSKTSFDNSLRVYQSNISDISVISNKDVLPDLETILLQKAREQKAPAMIVSNTLLNAEKLKENIKTQVDEGWLERNTVQNNIKTNAKTKKIADRNSLKESRNSTYGLANIDLSTLEIKPTPDLDQQIPVQEINLLSIKSNVESEISKITNPEILPSAQLKKLKMKHKSHDSDSVVDDSEEEKEMEEYRHIVKKKRVFATVTGKLNEEIKFFRHNKNNLGPALENTADDLLNSREDDEEYELKIPKGKRKKAVIRKTTKSIKKVTTQEKKTSNKLKNNINTRTAKRSDGCEKNSVEENEDKPLDPEDLKYTLAMERADLISTPRIKLKDLENADNLAHKYISSLAMVTSSRPTPVTDSEVKRAADKRKLKEKIATNKLNENFVTINIQKKKFVRGKKNLNYSKYKKNLWKHKKRIAALSGPDMDMGGCDGGTLKCFNCGKAGHFAQNCKMNSDSLLPLTAQLEVDESPFPTLEEAEHMASQLAVAVHGRNIAKMPQAPNAAIYNEIEYDDGRDEVKVSVEDNHIDSTSMEESSPKEYLMETDEELENFDVASVALETKAISPIKKYIGSKIPDEFLKAAGIDPINPNSNNSNQFRTVGPLYDLNADGSVKEVTTEVLKSLKMFGHSNFRKGQDRAVMRILSGMSTLVTLSTGSGKSLCYQLPAYLYSKHKKSITLVISPLVSLMEDQVTGIPHFLRAHCLHTNQTPQQKVKIMKMIADGEVDILLLSPEAVVAGERSTGFGSILRQLPPIAFACIDEAHCVSQWSHNFRPSYLMICKVLKQNLGVKCVLGLTATATLPTRISIINHLGILDGERGVISDIPLPDNLILSVSKDENRDAAMLQLLLSKRFEACQSIIIYCTRRDECERVAGYLRTCLPATRRKEQENEKKKRKRTNWHAEPYHAGMPASRRRTVQNAFMSNELRIVVATIAFGMGINKPDIRAVIHYNMPRNFESYVQEVGRAGRDNKISHCHLFLDANGSDQNELRRHIYANSLDRHVIRKLLQHIFVPCSCDKTLKNGDSRSSEISNEELKKFNSNAPVFDGEGNSKARPHICQGHEIGFSIENTVEALDIPEENISTLLCYMELDARWCISVLSNAYMKVKVISYGGPKYLKYAAKECPPLAMAIAMEIKNGCFKEDCNIIEFSVIDIAAAIGWNSGVVKYQLKNLEWLQVNGCSKRSPITISFYDLGFRIKAPGDFTAEEIDDALDSLYNRSVKQELTQLIQLQYIFQGLSSVAYNTYGPCCNEKFSDDRSNQLKGIIRDYFCNDYPKNLKLQIEPSNISDAELESDVISLINMYPENNFSGRNIARIFHGISSPNYPAVMWYRCKFWRVHSKCDFNRIVQLANNVIVKRRT